VSLKNKLQRMKGHLVREPVNPSPAASPPAEIPYLDKWLSLHAKPFFWDDDFVMVREIRYPLAKHHGKHTFAELFDVIDAWSGSGLAHPLSASGRCAEDLLFFDTETTGLHGGAGNTIFLLGYSRFDGEDVVVRQHVLADPHAEAALYQSFLRDVSSSAHLVTFNGKTFDWPQVKTRHTLVRSQVPELPSWDHIDLLHAARRLWRHELESCRLSLIEREKLGVSRKHDVPGHLAPILYFDYLQTRDPEVIQGVLRHNEWDVLSLITLYIHLSRLLLDGRNPGVSWEERFEAARWYEALGQHETAAEWYRMIAESGHPLRTRARIALGLQYKKQKQWGAALAIWEELIERTSPLPEEVCIEAAKICEHQLKDYERALYYTRLAFEEWKKKRTILRRTARIEGEAYRKRIERLEMRLERGQI